MRAYAAITIALGGALGLAVAAEEDASGRDSFWQASRASAVWRTDYFRSSKSFDDETGFLGTTLQLKALPTLSDRVDAKVEIRATSSNEGGGHAEVRAIEAYARVRFPNADLFLGKQIVAWGRADGINPTDNLTPRDFTVLLPFEDDQRFGTTSLKLDAYLSPQHTLTVFATPFFEPAKLPLPAAAGLPAEHEPGQQLEDSEVGVRLNKTGAAVDWSVSLYRGFDLLPTVRAVDGETGLYYDRMIVLGADVARNFGRFGFRGELAYVRKSHDPEAKASPGYWHWIAGVDRTFGDNWNVNLQLFQQRVRSFGDPSDIADPVAREIATQNGLIRGQLDRITNGATFRLSHRWRNDTLEAEVFAVVNLTRDDGFFRPLVTYAFNDRWRGTIGAELYRGADDTRLGAGKRNRGAFAELRYGF